MLYSVSHRQFPSLSIAHGVRALLPWLLLVAILPAAAQGNHLRRVGAWPYGPSKAVAVDTTRNLVFLGSGGAVLILDGSDVTQPALVSESLHSDGLVLDLFFERARNLLHVAAGEGGYDIWNVADPADPVRLSHTVIDYFGVHPPVNNVEVYESYAILECAWGYVQSLDVSDPAAPVQIGFNGAMGNPARDIYISQVDGQIHSSGAQRYQRIHVQEDGTLNTSGSRDFDQGPGAVFGTPDVAYVGWAGQLFILDLHAPGFLPWSAPVVNGVRDVVVVDQRAYILNRDGLQIWDVAVHNAPVFLGRLSRQMLEFKLVVAGDYAYIPDGRHGLRIVDIADAAQPVEVGGYDVPGVTWQAMVRGNHAFLAHSDDGMIVLEVNEGVAPVQVGRYSTRGETRDLTLWGDHAVIADWTGGLRIVDISDPTAPVETGVLTGIDAWRVRVVDSVAWVIEAIPNQPYRLRAVDLTDPAAPVEIGSLQMPGTVWTVESHGNYLVLAGDDSGVHIVDIGDPANPVPAGHFAAPGVFDVAIQNDLAYVAAIGAVDGGFYILDLSDPSAPVQLGHYGPAGFRPFHVAVSGNYAYLADSGDLHLFFIDDPANPAPVETFRLPGNQFELIAPDDRIFISDGEAGLQILSNTLIGDPGGGLAWETRTSGTAADLNGVAFVSPMAGWAVGDAGVILSTADGGVTWSPQTATTAADLRSLDMASPLTGVVVGGGGAILRTTDGGAHWQAVPSGTVANLTDIVMADADRGWAVGTGGTILKTTDGGASWSVQTAPVGDALHSVDAVDGNHAWVAVGSFGDILRTTDGGSTWEARATGSGDILYAIDFVTADSGWVVGSFGDIRHTADGGLSWMEQHDVPPHDWLYGLEFVDAHRGWTVGFGGKIMATTDGGATWSLELGGVSDRLKDVRFLDGDHGWAVGENGTILQARRSATGLTPDPVSPRPTTMTLGRNYPNPFNPSTVIPFELRRSGHVTLTVYDAVGRRVAVLVDGERSSGHHAVRWNGRTARGDAVASGVYLYRLVSGERVQTRTMVLMK